MADLRQLRTMNIDKVRKLLRASAIRMKDTGVQGISKYARYDAAYDAAFLCALAYLEANKLEMEGKGHHREALTYLVTSLKLKGDCAELIAPMVQARNSNRYDGDLITDERLVLLACEWATRIRAEAESWFKTHLPQALKD